MGFYLLYFCDRLLVRVLEVRNIFAKLKHLFVSLKKVNFFLDVKVLATE